MCITLNSVKILENVSISLSNQYLKSAKETVTDNIPVLITAPFSSTSGLCTNRSIIFSYLVVMRLKTFHQAYEKAKQVIRQLYHNWPFFFFLSFFWQQRNCKFRTIKRLVCQQCNCLCWVKCSVVGILLHGLQWHKECKALGNFCPSGTQYSRALFKGN